MTRKDSLPFDTLFPRNVFDAAIVLLQCRESDIGQTMEIGKVISKYFQFFLRDGFVLPVDDTAVSRSLTYCVLFYGPFSCIMSWPPRAEIHFFHTKFYANQL